MARATTRNRDLPERSPYESFLSAVASAPNETAVREAFVALAAYAFRDTTFADELALGAEYSVSFRAGGLVRRGRIDSFIDNVLIEFKKDIRRDPEQHLDQLRGYVAGAWGEDQGYDRPYVCVLTDGLRWRVFAAAPADPYISPDSDNVVLASTDAWQMGNNAAASATELAHFLNRIFFRHTLLSPSAENFARDFGIASPAFMTVATRLRATLRELAGESQMRTHREAWAEDIRTSYGGADTPEELFVRHTYLALLTRLLVFVALEHRPLKDSEADAVLDGTFFVGKRIGNFVEDDYFQWPLLATRSRLKDTWGALVQQLQGYDLAVVREDVLKPLYEQLVDPETRHDLGEYYTPDWLAEEVADAALEPWLMKDERPRILDPTCGSGSFLRAALRRLRAEWPKEPRGALLTLLLHSVTGMDVNPLAVTVSKATYLLTVADLVKEADEVVHLPVFLCNSLSAQERTQTSSLFGEEVSLVIGDRGFSVPLDLVQHGPDFDRAVAEVVTTARSFAGTGQPSAAVAEAVTARLSALAAKYLHGELLLDSLRAMTSYLVDLIEMGRDTIHGFLLRNKYRSVLLYRQFDLVIGNPPWLTISDVTAPGYRELVLQRASDTKLTARSAGEQAHTELATLFLGHVFFQFVAPRSEVPDLPRVAFVMPRSIFTATHHRPLREGTYTPAFNVSALWDLKDVQPLFNVPSCVLFATEGKPRVETPKKGRIYHAQLPARDPDPADVSDTIRIEKVDFALGWLGKRTAWRPVGETGGSELPVIGEPVEVSAYQSRFRQGAVLYPQTLLCVQTVGADGRGPGDVAVESDPRSRASAKVLPDAEIRGVVERSGLFSTAAAQHILPFTLAPRLWTVVLPVASDPGSPDFGPVDPAALRRAGRVGVADWFDEADEMWRAQAKPGPPLWERLDHLGHLSAQADRSRWLVLYTSAGSRPVACVVDTNSTEYPFVVRDQTYWASFYNPTEAHYVAAALNSNRLADEIRAFMTTGLFGPRHIHKRVLDVPVPEFDPSNEQHQELAACGSRLAIEATQLAIQCAKASSTARRQVRANLPSNELRNLEALVGKILAGPG